MKGGRSLGRRKGIPAIHTKKHHKKEKGLYDAHDYLFVQYIYMEVYKHEFLHFIILSSISFPSYLHSFLPL